jgi:hypothetical protein
MAVKYFNTNNKNKHIVNNKYWDEIHASKGKIKSINDVVNVSFI